MGEATTARRRRYHRWVQIGDRDIRSLCQAARSHGMKIIHAIKYDMSIWNGIALFGTRNQIRAVEADWEAGGNEVAPRKPSRYRWAAVVGLPRERWQETTVDWTVPGTRWSDRKEVAR